MNKFYDETLDFLTSIMKEEDYKGKKKWSLTVILWKSKHIIVKIKQNKVIIVKEIHSKQSDTRSNFISEKIEIGFVVYVCWSLSFKKCSIVPLYMCDRRHKCNNRWFQGDDIKLQYLCSIVFDCVWKDGARWFFQCTNS